MAATTIIAKSSCHLTAERDAPHYSTKKITLTKVRLTTKSKTISEIHSNQTNSKALFNKCQLEIRTRN